MTMSRGVERIHAALKWKESTPTENKTDDDDHDNHADDDEDDDDLDHDAS